MHARHLTPGKPSENEPIGPIRLARLSKFGRLMPAGLPPGQPVTALGRIEDAFPEEHELLRLLDTLTAPAPQYGTLSTGGFSLDYVAEGRGPAALVIGSAVYYPRTFSATLRAHLRLIFADHRGFGVPTAPFTNADFELDVLVEDFEALRHTLGIPQWIVIGHSGHAHMALAYAKKYPERISHLVLIANSPDASPASFAAADRYLEESADLMRKNLLDLSMREYPARVAANPDRRFVLYGLCSGPRIWFDPHFDAAPLWEGVRLVPAMFDYVWGQVFATIDLRAGLDRVSMPVFLGLGRYDFWNPPHLWDAYRDAFADLRVRVFERSGHTPQLEEPERFNQELLSWLREKGAALG